MKLFPKLLSVTVALSFLSVGFASAESETYTTMAVSGGGTLTGKVSFKGAQPAPEKFEFAKFPQPNFCSKVGSDSEPGSGKGFRIRQDVKVTGGGLGDVVVYITDITKGKEFKQTETAITAENCQFLIQGGPSKAVGVVVNAKKSGVKDPIVKVTNMDADPSDPKTVEGVLHNPHGYDIKDKISATIFNKPVPKKGQSISEKVLKTWFKKDDSFLKVECDQHNYMNVWALPVSNPYYAVVNPDGTFNIDQIPAGTYEVKAFHPKLGFKSTKIEVKASAATTANFDF